jgi:hypothetical protein
MNTAGGDESSGVGNMTTHKRLQCQIHQANAESEVMTWSLAETEWVTTQL